MNLKLGSKFGMGIGLFGFVLSFVLAIEYFSLGTQNIGSSLCSATGGGNSCDQVASSSYSAFRSIPFIGDIPIAVFGAGFYSTLVFLFFKAFKEEESSQDFIVWASTLSILGICIDMILLYISIGILGTICHLCLMTYLVTALSFATTFLVLSSRKVKPSFSFPEFNKMAPTLALVFFFGCTVTQFASKSLSNGDKNLASSKSFEDSNTEAKAILDSEDLQVKYTASGLLGKKAAPITIVKFADFNCGHCQHTSEILHAMLSEYDGMVKVHYQNFPLDGSCNRFVPNPRPEASSCVAAIASICADKQGKFEAMYRGLYENQSKGVYHTSSTVMNLANLLGLNSNQFKSCMGSREASTELSAQIEEAGRLNINATPTLYINGRKLRSGTPEPKFLKAVLEEAIKRL